MSGKRKQPFDTDRIESPFLAAATSDNLAPHGHDALFAMDPGFEDRRSISGNNKANTLNGTGKADKLNGKGGNDKLNGAGGNDNLIGGGGNDTLNGGTGGDKMNGGGGNDIFVYKSTKESSGKGIDKIAGFASSDKIDLSAIGKTVPLGFSVTGAAANSVWVEASGKTSKVQVDTNGDAKADMTISVSAKQALTAANFLGLDAVAPTVESAVWGVNDGTLKAGDTIDLTLTLTEAVKVTGAPAIQLSSGGKATYLSGSDSKVLVFSYVVGATDSATDLAYTGLALATGDAIADKAGNALVAPAAQANPSGIVVDTAAPIVQSVTFGSNDGTLRAGETVSIAVQLSEAVAINGTPTLTLSSGGTATYLSTDGKGLLTFGYQVGATDNAADLTVTGLTLPQGATIKDVAGNHAVAGGFVADPAGTIVVDSTAPSVQAVTYGTHDGTLKAGETVDLVVTFAEAVKVAGAPQLVLDSGGRADFASISADGKTLTFTYVVGANQNSADLTVNALDLTAGTIRDAVGNDAVMASKINPVGALTVDTTAPAPQTITFANNDGTLKAGETITFDLDFAEAVFVTGQPVITLNSGAGSTATYTGGSGTTRLSFITTVQAGENATSLNVQSLTPTNGGAFLDAAGNPATVPQGGITVTGTPVAVDTVQPTITAVNYVTNQTQLKDGDIMTLEVAFNDIVKVNGAPTLQLNSGTNVFATYAGGDNTNKLLFTYTVGNGDKTGHLAASLLSLANGATIQDRAGNAANLGNVTVNPIGTLTVDGTHPAISAVTYGTTSNVTLAAGDTMTFLVKFNDNVVFDTTNGTPTLSLNSAFNAEAVLTGAGASANTLVFTYTVQPGDDANDLAITGSGINLNGGIISDAVGNGIIPTIAAALLDPPGVVKIDTNNASVVSTGFGNFSGPLNAGKQLDITVTFSEAVVVNDDTGSVTLSLSSGGTADYTSISADGKTLTFTYFVQSGQNTSHLDITSINVVGGATIKDLSNVSAVLPTQPIVPSQTVVIDTTRPQLSATNPLGASIASGNLNVDDTVSLTVTFNEAVNVIGSPTLLLSSGGTATFGGVAGKVMTFNYKVGALDSQADLTVQSLQLGNGESIRDNAGNDARIDNVSGDVTPNGILKIDNTRPTITSVTFVGADAGLQTGEQIEINVAFNEAVMRGGIPTLTLNSGGTATFDRIIDGPTIAKSVMVFKYTVLAGETTAGQAQNGLGVTGFVSNGATITDLATNPFDPSQLNVIPTPLVPVDGVAPRVTAASFTTANFDGTVRQGEVVTIAVDFSEAVTLDSTQGTPSIKLNSGATMSNGVMIDADTISFTYGVGAGQNATNLAITEFNLGNAKLRDISGNDVKVQSVGSSFVDISAIGTTTPTLTVDTRRPDIASVAFADQNTILSANENTVITITFDEQIVFTNGASSPTLTMSNNGTATFTGLSGPNAMTFTYSVPSTGPSPDTATSLFVSSLNLGLGSTIADKAGNLAVIGATLSTPSNNVTVDTTVPAPTQIRATSPAGNYTLGQTIEIAVDFQENVYVDLVGQNMPFLTLNAGTGTKAIYDHGTSTSTLYFRYTVGIGDSSADLGTQGLNLNSATLRDAAGNLVGQSGFNADLTPGGSAPLTVDGGIPGIASVNYSYGPDPFLKAGDIVDFTIKFSETVAVVGTPKLSLDIAGAEATYQPGAQSDTLTFRYQVLANQNSNNLSITGMVLGTGVSIRDLTGNNAVFTGLTADLLGDLKVDTTNPTLGQTVGYDSTITRLHADQIIDFTVNFSEEVQVLPNGSKFPELVLNNGARAVYFSGTDSANLIFRYQVQAGKDEDTGSLSIFSLDTNTASIRDYAGNDATVSGWGPQLSGNISVDTINPFVVANGSSILTPNGLYNPGDTIEIALQFQENVTVNHGTNAPVLNLSNNGVATYDRGSGFSLLVFKYLVQSTDANAADITISGVNLNGGSIVDSSGNPANFNSLIQAPLNDPFGTVQIDTSRPDIQPGTLTIGNFVNSKLDPVSGTQYLNQGDTVDFTVAFGEPVNVAAGAALTLNSGGKAVCATASSGSTITFRYTVGAGDTTGTGQLKVTGFDLSVGTITDIAGNPVITTSAFNTPATIAKVDNTAPLFTSITYDASASPLNAGKSVDIFVNFNEAIATNPGAPPSLNLNNGAVAAFTGNDGNGHLKFTYTVGLNDVSTGDLIVSSINLNSSAITDLAGNAASLSGITNVNPAGTLAIDTEAPTITGVTYLPINGDTALKQGESVQIKVSFKEDVVLNGNPTLTMNTGETASFNQGSSGPRDLYFTYTVNNPSPTFLANLAIQSMAVGVSIKDVAGNNADLSGATKGTPSGISVDVVAPAPSISSVLIAGNNVVDILESAQTLTITGNAGDARNGDAVTAMVNGKAYTGTVTGGTFTISGVAGSDLVNHMPGASNPFIGITLVATDTAGNSTPLSQNFNYTLSNKVDVSTLDTTLGFSMLGVGFSNNTGQNISSAGDVNGDGIDDLLITSKYAYGTAGVSQAGRTYIVYGKTGTQANIDLNALTTATGLVLLGTVTNEKTGIARSAGDVNGDGYDDIIVGAFKSYMGGKGGGTAYLVYGGPSSSRSSVQLQLSGLGTAGNTEGIAINGKASGDRLGGSVSAAGDIDGDGYGDLIVGADGNDLTGNTSQAGQAYVIWGKALQSPGTFAVAGINSTTGAIISGETANNYLGKVSAAGDVNGDGFDDVIAAKLVTAPYLSGGPKVYVIYGSPLQSALNTALSSFNSNQGFTLAGNVNTDFIGASMSNAGDVNGDGYDDVIVGGANAAYVVYGSASPSYFNLNVTTMVASQGFKIQGSTSVTGGIAAYSVRSAGDVNGDGFADMIVGTQSADNSPSATDTGKAWVVFGAASRSSPLDLSSLSLTDGFVISGSNFITNDFLGSDVSSAGDVNHDGYDDLLIGASGRDSQGVTNSGGGYVLYGGSFGRPSTAANLATTNGADKLVGSWAENTFTNIDSGDVARGGAGNDVFIFTNIAFADIDGGHGKDTLTAATAGGTLDLSAMNARLKSIEVIDLTAAGNHVVSLNSRDVLMLSEDTSIVTINNVPQTRTVLTIHGNGSDTVDVTDGANTTGWSFIGLTANGERIFDDGAARLIIDAGIVFM